MDTLLEQRSFATVEELFVRRESVTKGTAGTVYLNNSNTLEGVGNTNPVLVEEQQIRQSVQTNRNHSLPTPTGHEFLWHKFELDSSEIKFIDTSFSTDKGLYSREPIPSLVPDTAFGQGSCLTDDPTFDTFGMSFETLNM